MIIGYLTEPEKEYVAAIRSAASPAELIEAIRPFARIAADALAVAEGMDVAAWTEFSRGLKSEGRGKYAGDAWAERFGAIILPAVMIEVTAIAEHFKAPWGVAFIRMLDAGRLVERDGVVSVVRPKPAAKDEPC